MKEDLVVGTEDDRFHSPVLILDPLQDLGEDVDDHDLVLTLDLNGMDQIGMIAGCMTDSVSWRKRTHIRGAESVKSPALPGELEGVTEEQSSS